MPPVIILAVIPAKAGIHFANLQESAVERLDSRFRGSDRRYETETILRGADTARSDVVPAPRQSSLRINQPSRALQIEFLSQDLHRSVVG
jgi:hypothetical protein